MIENIIAGYHRFRGGYYEENRERLVKLARDGQSPKVAVVACCDSRVDPAVITDSAPGELFVIRNVANLVPPCEGEGVWHGTSAALQFAVCGLAVEHIIVLGHAQCGGIRALLKYREDACPQEDFIAAWMSIADEARKQVLARADLRTFDEQARSCELRAIEISLANLQTFPWIREPVECGKLHLHGWYYNLGTGDLLCLDSVDGVFKPVWPGTAMP